MAPLFGGGPPPEKPALWIAISFLPFFFFFARQHCVLLSNWSQESQVNLPLWELLTNWDCFRKILFSTLLPGTRGTRGQKTDFLQSLLKRSLRGQFKGMQYKCDRLRSDPNIILLCFLRGPIVAGGEG